ncbi:hypothetical protein [uncultured Methanobrevibacter sp.]|nr:hypothetical protein [uncultured Methanobrevibacter sp.]
MDFLKDKCVENSDLLAGISHTVTTLTLPNRAFGFKLSIFYEKQ